ncbi:unnamed protein product [Ectocarpus fasciculatus]
MRRENCTTLRVVGVVDKQGIFLLFAGEDLLLGNVCNHVTTVFTCCAYVRFHLLWPSFFARFDIVHTMVCFFVRIITQGQEGGRPRNSRWCFSCALLRCSLLLLDVTMIQPTLSIVNL